MLQFGSSAWLSTATYPRDIKESKSSRISRSCCDLGRRSWKHEEVGKVGGLEMASCIRGGLWCLQMGRKVLPSPQKMTTKYSTRSQNGRSSLRRERVMTATVPYVQENTWGISTALWPSIEEKRRKKKTGRTARAIPSVIAGKFDGIPLLFGIGKLHRPSS